MPSALVEQILADFRATPGSELNLKKYRPSEFLDADLVIVAERLPGLTSLNLDNCKQVTDAGVMAVADKLTALTSLNLSNCVLVTDAGVEAVANKLSALTTLDLWACEELTDVSMNVVYKNLSELTYLNLGLCNKLTVDSTKRLADKLRRLTFLELRSCGNLTDVGVMEIANKLTGLTHLGLGWCNQLTDVSVKAVADKLTALSYLDLRSCEKLTDAGVMAVANKLSGLTDLLFSWCKEVTDAGVMAVADKLTALTSLELTNCDKVTDAGVMAVADKLTALTYLSLYNCEKVTDAGVMAVADKLTALTYLNLNNCKKVTDAGVMAVADKLTRLTSLNLTRCRQVTDAGVQAVADKLTRLTSLDLSYCHQVTDAGVKAVADKLTALTSLNLTSCEKVTDAGVKAVADKLTRLTNLDVSEIPSLRIPQELLQDRSNLAAIRAYYSRGEREGKRQLNEAKLIVVGNEAVGKSALVNFLVEDRPCTDSAKTEGVNILDRINVAKWDVKEGTAGVDPLRLNVWDFGGQEVLYETHRFFLTARSLYLIVLEARRENIGDAEAVLHDWMRAVRNRGGEEVPIIVVVNKAESPHDLRLDEVRLRMEYPAIRAFIRTSCRSPEEDPEGGKGIFGLRRLIVEVVRNDLPHVRDWLPASYFQVKEAVGTLAREESMLSTARYATICVEAGVREESEQDTLLALLDQIGVVVKHSETTLLDPNWLTTAVYRILTHDDVGKASGEFDQEDLGRLLAGLKNADRYPKKWWSYIAGMMVRFNLSFELDDQPGRYIVPERLPTQEPNLNWDEAGSLRFRYDYENLPRGLLPRFIVEMHRHLSTNRIAWVSGVVLTVDGCEVLVRADRKNRQVHVFVAGPNGERRGALAIVRVAFVKLHGLYGDLKITAMVPVRVPEKSDAAIEYETLVAFERQGAEIYAYPGAEKPFFVKTLLEGVGPEPRTQLPLNQHSSPVVNNYFLKGDAIMAKYENDLKGAQIGAMAVGDTATASSTGNLTQQHGMDSKTAAQLATLLDELLGILKTVEVPKTSKPKLDETVTAVEEAKVIATSATPEKGKLSATFDKVKGWVNGALSVGMFAEEAANKVGDLIGRIGRLLV